jgi:zinc protease
VVPLIAVAFTFEGGSAQDPEGKAGVAQMLARLLDEGAGELNSGRLPGAARRARPSSSPSCRSRRHRRVAQDLVKHADEAFELLRLALANRVSMRTRRARAGQTSRGLRYQQNDPG